MAAKKRARKKPIKLKLKKNTVYTIFGLGSIFSSVIMFLSFFNTGESTAHLRSLLEINFGGAAFLFPFIFIFFGFLLLHLKMFLSKVNVFIGYLLFFVSVVGLTRSGAFGGKMFGIFQEILTIPGADVVFILGIIVGTIVVFDTSMDEILEGFKAVGRTMARLYPGSLFKKSEGQSSLDRTKPMQIKGLQKDAPAIPVQNEPPKINKKEPELLSEKLVSNMMSGNGPGIWEYPPLSLLSDIPGQKADRGDVNKTASLIEKTLQSFGVDARVAEVNLGPAVTQYALEIALGTKITKITSLASNLALATEAPGGQIRIEAPIPGRNLVGIEIPNKSLEVVPLKTMLASANMQKSKSKLSTSMGLDVSGSPLIADIAKMPHALVAGTTGSGKSAFLNSMLCSLLFRASPSEVKLILVDPKRVEFTAYNGIPHLLTPVIVEVEKILSALKWAVSEMDRRYKIFAERGVRNIEGYNELSGFQALPYIVIVIDELADLMMFAPVEVEDAIARLAQMARAVGIHLIIATQRPSVNVITGLIKANVPCRIAFNVSSQIDSRVILDSQGAEKLLGRGDMLFVPPEQAKATRIQGAWVSEKEIKKLVEYLKAKNIPLEYTEEILNQPTGGGKNGKAGTSGGGSSDGKDEMFEDAVRLVCQFNNASASFLQRKMSVGYSRAARILDQLEENGIVGPADGSKARDILVRNAEEYLSSLNQQQ
jgi:S-DNA-T family DNA segregation ATPase FtsK/SpoIIIE